MRHYYTADAIREAEAPLLASLPDGVLMRRAAYGLAGAIARELRARTGGDRGSPGLRRRRLRRQRRRRAVGGDLPAPPRRGGRRPSCSTRNACTARRSPRSPASGGRIVESVPPATDLVIDGVVGISGCGSAAARRRRGVRRRRRCRHPRRGRRPSQRRRRAHRRGRRTRTCSAALTVTFGGLKPVHALGDCGRVELVDIGLDLPDADLRRPRGRRRRRPLADARARATTSTPRASPACWPARRPTRVRPSCAPAPPSPPPRAWCATREALPPRWFRTGPRSIAAPTASAAGRVQAWVVGPGLGTDEAGAAALWFALDTDLPVIVDADALTILAAHPDLVAGRTRADRADPARRRVRAAGRSSAGRRPGRRHPRARRRASAPPCC